MRVPRFAKVFLFVFLGLLVLAGLVLLSANIYVQKAASQTRIEKRLCRALRLPVTISHASIRPWGSLHLAGITAPQNPPASDNFLEVAGLTADFQLMPVLSRRLVMENLLIDEPRICWRQNAQGKWSWPSPSAPPKETAKKEPSAQRPIQPRKSFEFSLQRASLRGGSFDLFNNAGQPVAQISGLNVECPSFDPGQFRGRMLSQEAVVGKNVHLQNVRAPFRYDAQNLYFEPLEADLAGGRLQGKFRLEHSRPGTPFTAEAQLADIDSNRLLEETAGWSDRLAGNMSGTLLLDGNMGESKSIKGQGHLELSSGRIKKSDLLTTLGQVMRIEELMAPELKEAFADFRIADEKVYIDRLTMKSINFSLEATGVVRFNTKLDLKVLLTINEKISRHLPNFVLANLQPGPQPNELVIPFDIKGTTSKPNTNIVERLLGQKIEEEVGGLFQSLFGPKKKKDKQP